MLLFASVCAAQNISYPSPITIMADDGSNVVANISTNGKVFMSSKVTAEDVINLLITRMISQNQQFEQEREFFKKTLTTVRDRATQSCQMAQNIILTWNPPSPSSPKVEQPKKKSFFGRLFGK